MATLSFSEKNGVWVAQTTVNKDYALHIERESSVRGGFYMKQCSVSSGNYAECQLPDIIATTEWKTIDWTFAHGYYPMKLEFESKVPISKAEINEIAE